MQPEADPATLGEAEDPAVHHRTTAPPYAPTCGEVKLV
jgi:hypothetical protein